MCSSYTQVVDKSVDNFVVGVFVVDKWRVIERRTHVRACFTLIKTYVLLQCFYAKKHIKYMRKCILAVKHFNLT